VLVKPSPPQRLICATKRLGERKQSAVAFL